MKLFSLSFCSAALFLCSIVGLSAQTRTAKYGADFMSGGVDARALALGNTHQAFANRASAGYWNAAGLTALQHSDLMYMHAERFSGIVSFDYLAYAKPLSSKSVFAISAIRSGVDDIQDTRDAWDANNDTPKPNPQNFFRSFSVADYAFLASYGRKINNNLSVGTSAKVIRRKIGDFADAFGYSLDLSSQYQKGKVKFGLQLQDITQLMQTWSINEAEFEAYRAEFGVPTGGTEKTLPLVRFGTAYSTKLGNDIGLTTGFDVDVAFDGQQSFAPIASGDMSVHGAELDLKNTIAFRAGLGNFSKDGNGDMQMRPALGVGLKFKQLYVDYAFGDFAGATSDLGNSHILSLRLSLEK
jgi:hypothetical protein